MIFNETELAGAFVVELERKEDRRGFFARAWCREEFERQGLSANIAQCNVSYNINRGTLRGMHYQAAPYEEVKLVRCTKGAIHDVILDLRPQSSTYLKHVAVQLSAENHRMVYIPKGCAHGFQTLEDDTEVFYQMSREYEPEYSRGARWNDPAFAIQWPIENSIIMDRDNAYPDYSVVR